MRQEQIPQHLEEYFISLRDKEGINLTEEQKWWYYRKWCVLGDLVQQEYPSTPQEAFLASDEAYFFANEIQGCRKDGRVIPLKYNPDHLVYVSFDIGMFDHTVLWFYQWYDQRLWFIDYYEDNNKPYDFYVQFALQEKPYFYGKFFLPHDAAKRDDVTLLSYADKVRRILDEKHIETHVLEQDDPIIGINLGKVVLNSCYFDSVKCDKGISHLSKYKKKWKEGPGWIHEPQHTIHSHAADSFRYACISLDFIKRGINQDLEKHKAALARANRMI